MQKRKPGQPRKGWKDAARKKFVPADKPLGEPKMKFEDTFSAEEIVLAELNKRP